MDPQKHSTLFNEICKICKEHKIPWRRFLWSMIQSLEAKELRYDLEDNPSIPWIEPNDQQTSHWLDRPNPYHQYRSHYLRIPDEYFIHTTHPGRVAMNEIINTFTPVDIEEGLPPVYEETKYLQFILQQANNNQELNDGLFWDIPSHIDQFVDDFQKVFINITDNIPEFWTCSYEIEAGNFNLPSFEDLIIEYYSNSSDDRPEERELISGVLPGGTRVEIEEVDEDDEEEEDDEDDEDEEEEELPGNASGNTLNDWHDEDIINQVDPNMVEPNPHKELFSKMCRTIDDIKYNKEGYMNDWDYVQLMNLCKELFEKI